MAAGEDLEQAAGELAKSAELDLFGRRRYQVLLFQLTGAADGRELTRTVVLRANDGFELSGTLGALAVSGVVRGELPAGLHYAADVLDPDITIDRLHGTSAVSGIELVDGPADAGAEEGAL